jgi:uncharacterized protein (TIGR03086 family)
MNHHSALVSAIDLGQSIFDAGPIGDPEAPTPCREFDVTALVDHLVGTHHFLAAAAGSEAAPVDGEPAERHRTAGAAAIDAWARRGVDGSVALGGHELPASFARDLHVLEAYVHAWDLATATGRPFAPAPEVTDVAWEAARAVISDDARSAEPGAPYGPETVPEDGADDVARLIAFTGRDPDWTA